MTASSLPAAAEPTTTAVPEADPVAAPVDATSQLRARSEQLAVDRWLREVASS
jgi:hypothetical protein